MQFSSRNNTNKSLDIGMLLTNLICSSKEILHGTIPEPLIIIRHVSKQAYVNESAPVKGSYHNACVGLCTISSLHRNSPGLLPVKPVLCRRLVRPIHVPGLQLW